MLAPTVPFGALPVSLLQIGSSKLGRFGVDVRAQPSRLLSLALNRGEYRIRTDDPLRARQVL